MSAAFEGVLYGYTGKGVGTTGLFILADFSSGDTRKSDGGYVQATYKFDKLKLGLSYGISDLKLAGDEQPGQIHGESIAAQAQRVRRASAPYYSLTKSVTLVGEYIDTKSTRRGAEIRADGKGLSRSEALFSSDTKAARVIHFGNSHRRRSPCVADFLPTGPSAFALDRRIHLPRLRFYPRLRTGIIAKKENRQ